MRARWEAQFWAHAKLPVQKAGEGAALTQQERQTLRQAARNLSANGYSVALYDEMTVIAAAGWASANELLDLSLEFASDGAFVLDEVERNASSFAVLVNQREQQALLDTIETGVADGMTPRELAASIRATFADGYHAYAADGTLERVIPTPSWSQMVARTELARAQSMGQVALYKAAQIRQVMWATTEGANVCAECAARDGEIFSMQDYDAEPAPLHPNCACTAIAADSDVNPSPA